MLECDGLWDLVERRAVASPDALLAVDEHGRRLSFDGLRTGALAVAGALAERGVVADSRVAWMLPTRIDTLVLNVALARLGAIQLPLIPAIGMREVGFITRQARPELFVVNSQAKRGEPERDVERATRVGNGAPRIATLEDLLAEHSRATLPPPPEPIVEPSQAPWRWIFYTSGTTSEPKGARHSDATIAGAARGIVPPHRLVAADRVSLVFPYAHIGGPQLLFSALLVGHALILTETFDPRVVIDTFSREGVTLAGPGPVFWQAFIEAQRAQPERRLFPMLRALIGGGAAKPTHLHRDAHEVLGVDIVSGYGLTECPALAYNHLGDPESVLATDGRAVAGVEMKIVRPDGGRAEPGVEGEILVRGPMRFLGYLDPDLDCEAFDEEGFVRTGDLGTLDADGQLRVTGRRKDVIIRKGENISARELEELLADHPAIREIAVVGLPDPERGERCCAVVVPAEQAAAPDLEEVREFCLAAGLARYKIPEQVETLETLPVNSTGKILKTELRARFG